jgi:hypothetical protein
LKPLKIRHLHPHANDHFKRMAVRIVPSWFES